MTRSTHAKWDPDLGGTFKRTPMPPSNRRGRTALDHAGAIVAIPPSVPPFTKQGAPDLPKRFTRLLERAIAERVKERAEEKKQRRETEDASLREKFRALKFSSAPSPRSDVTP